MDFGRETPKFRFEFCRGFFGGFFPHIFFKEKGPKKSTKKSPTKFTQDFVWKKAPRISAEAFLEKSQHLRSLPFGCLMFFSLFSGFNRHSDGSESFSVLSVLETRLPKGPTFFLKIRRTVLGSSRADVHLVTSEFSVIFLLIFC